ncbi:hypothetical protein [Pseudoalteromonas luteoviolacea]|uniref:Peptidase M1 membrane alanine aminopeptidase domain-containing protein n=1 Tax=Pseudoalteromonas luteoviolacea S4054 TaxID=1129367 RepID=A0A0F6A726_9GAMM|nr:hypothetical protein [Pseudoalteromonas luteoviolacea]AOT07688.1 hypothetical protein S4054249_07440 [Pseudoalteromonas luteoviolacea]AOT12604.1 hypothetical protein S40542_07440 [Pseudoalteromonas luteoviolacea]AOT17518.1 hypothetical protein S4054_07440 [Pseudoalteromonas luteoviolacea]KKE81224.1 hypothetical protein N479_23365 [Pseudoalteromonas luteoviolacea S4054]KZN66352.1 hypothetical protein N481_24460 [Pseudoalteromonas luteoviolacea S4047-1]
MLKQCILLILAVFSPILFAAQVFTYIEKHPDNTWTVTYRVDTPVNKLVFNRTPDNSRVKRWQPNSPNYVISFSEENVQESITRKDGHPFSQVTIKLTPTYTPLPKEYAPFSPFSDNGILIHSARFFACASTCNEGANAWPIEVRASGNHMIVDGKVHKDQAQWIAKNSGQKVYVGQTAPIEDTHFVSLIDGHLPSTLKKHIEQDLPKLMDFFANKMGPLDYRPALFASFSDTTDGKYGRQGGTLSNQIFMHWYGNKAIEQVDSESIFWFFAHEVAHLYQKQGSDIETPTEAWLHEGAAEFLAGIASAKVANNTDLLSQKVAIAQHQCIEGLADQPIYIRAVKSNPRLHYSCGLVLINEINDALTARKSTFDIFSAWQVFNLHIKSGKPASVATFIEGMKPYLSQELVSSLMLLTQSAHFNAATFFKKLAKIQNGNTV